jgi:hypothetical protein
MTDHQPDRGDRRDRPVRVYRLGEEPADDLSALTTATERVEMVWELTRRMLELSGAPPPGYTRRSIPVRVIRPA